jgi:hypothetical protein
MPKKSSWTDEDLAKAVKESYSYRNVIKILGLVPAGGNYMQVQASIRRLNLDTAHFKGMGCNKGMNYTLPNVRRTLEEMLIKGSTVQSFKLKRRLFETGIKTPACELCGWAKKSLDGRIPVELDHINGDRFDNRIENLRILCPNCHSLQPTHRGRNKKTGLRYRSGAIPDIIDPQPELNI